MLHSHSSSGQSETYQNTSDSGYIETALCCAAQNGGITDQSGRFFVARRLECDLDLDAFDAKLKKIMKAKGPKRMTASQSHWDGTYSAKGDNVSWYQPGQSRSLEIKSIAAPMRGVPIIDIGAGGS